MSGKSISRHFNINFNLLRYHRWSGRKTIVKHLNKTNICLTRNALQSKHASTCIDIHRVSGFLSKRGVASTFCKVPVCARLCRTIVQFRTHQTAYLHVLRKLYLDKNKCIIILKFTTILKILIIETKQEQTFEKQYTH